MSHAEPGDLELVARAARSEPEAVRALYRRYGRLIYSVALRIMGDSSTAEEVTQDVFVKAWEKASLYDPAKSGVATWLSRIARNRAIDALRRREREERLHRDARAELETAGGRGGDDPALSQELASLREEVRAAVVSLPENQRKALMLAYFEGLTHSQIAARLGEPLGTVKTRIRDAMIALRGRLGGGRG